MCIVCRAFSLLGLYCACSSEALIVGSDHATSQHMEQGGTAGIAGAHAGGAGDMQSTAGQPDTGAAHEIPDMTTPEGDPQPADPVAAEPGTEPATDPHGDMPIVDGGLAGDTGAPDAPHEGGAGGTEANPDHPAGGEGGVSGEGGTGGIPG